MSPPPAPSGATSQIQPRGFRLRAQKVFEWALLAFLLIACIPPVVMRHQSLALLPSLNLVDDSWILDGSYKAAGGIWFGRDVAFTYGPLFQWLSSAPARWIGVSVGTVLPTWYMVPYLLIVLSTFFSARLLNPRASPWRRALFVLLAVVFWSPPDVRISLALLAFAMTFRLTAEVSTGRFPLAALGTAAATICAAAFLFSADTGIYAAAALLLCIGATALQQRSRALASFLIFSVATFAILAFPVQVLMPNFWPSSFAIASAYRWFEPSAMMKADKRFLLEIVALGITTFVVGWLHRQRRGRWTRSPAFLMAGFAFALVTLQSALVRSDRSHVLMGVYPMLFLCGLVALDEFDSRWLSIAAPLAAVLATVGFAHAFPFFRPANVADEFRQFIHPIAACPTGLVPYDRACLSPADAHLMGDVSGHVNLRAGAAGRIAIFPYETAFGIASRHQVAGGVLQSYLVNGSYLTDLQLDGLRRDDPPLALYLPDGAISVGVDGIPNFTRSPEVWFYYLRHYRADATPAAGVLGLVRDEARDGQVHFDEEKVAEPLRQIRIQKRSSTIDLGQVRWPAAGADFIKLRLRIDYPMWWRIRKPSKMMLRMVFADGSQKEVEFVAEPNRETDIWLYPWDARSMGRYFSTDQTQWRAATRPAVARLELHVNPFDWVSVIPNSVTIESIEAVRVSLQ